MVYYFTEFNVVIKFLTVTTRNKPNNMCVVALPSLID